jgi:transposase
MLDKYRSHLEEISQRDVDFYFQLLPAEHPLLDALELIPWESFVPELESHYSHNLGQPAFPPLRMLKLEFLRYFARLSDREVIARCQSDVLFRWFLQIPVRRALPDPSSLTRFRGRLGPEGFSKLFDRLVGIAREHDLVKDRLRLKDATHVIANIAVPSTIGLLASLRTKMLAAIKPIDPEAAIGFEIAAEQVRSETEAADPAIRLQARLDLVLDILHWIDQLSVPEEDQNDPSWSSLHRVAALARKITGDCQNPTAGHRTLSVVDPDARRGRHGEFYNGFLLDMLVDADSEIITQLGVIDSGADEARHAIDLIAKEQEAHGNDVQQISIDGIGFNGEVIAKLEDPAGPAAVDVITVPRDFNSQEGFSSASFERSDDGLKVICPAGQQSGLGHRNSKGNATQFAFAKATCAGCPLLTACLPKFSETSKKGRQVIKNDYEAQYESIRRKSQTAAYQEVRRRHPTIERKLGEVVRHGGGRRAKYWGRAKVHIQELMTGFVVNTRRIVKLLDARRCAVPAIC